MKYSYVFKYLTVALFSWMIVGVNATQHEKDAPEAHSVSGVEKLVAITRDIETIEAEFEQQVQDQFGNTKDESKGRFVLKKPFKFIWKTQSPFEQQIISNGETLWTFDQDLDQVNIESLNRAMGNTPVFFLGASAETLNKSFNVTLLPAGRSEAKTFELTPKAKEYAFERMLVLFKNNELQEILLKDTLGQQTVVEFSAIKVNQSVDDKMFEFSPPEFVDVIDSRTQAQPDKAKGNAKDNAQ